MSQATATLRITEERTFSAHLGDRTITGLAVASAWEGFTKYTNAAGAHLIVLDAEQRVVTASPDLIAELSDKPQIGDHFKGGIYAGLTDIDGQTAHLVLMPGEIVDATWEQSTKWAEQGGATLPTRAEQRTLYQNLKSEFAPRWYWSGEQFAADPSNAWFQNFVDGNQVIYRKSYAGRARAVRRFKI